MAIVLDKPRIRFAPSPTGFIHLGGLRMFFYNYLIAKKYNGTLIIRIEDTDSERFVSGAVENFLQTFSQFGLPHDEGPFLAADGTIKQRGDFGPYIQSQRLPLYAEHAQTLLAQGSAYRCFCSEERLQQLRERQIAEKKAPGYDGHCRDLDPQDAQQRQAAGESCVVRLRVPAGTTTYHDAVRGQITFDNATIDDQILLKSNGYPTYHLAVVVDDHAMQITHVTRGEEWIPSTPKHVLLYQAFGWEPPVFVHFPLILDTQRKKLSKRAMDVSVQSIVAKGYLPAALLNFCALLGWHPQDDREVFSVQELIEVFSVDRLQKAGAIFAMEKLDWMNAQHIRRMSTEEVLTAVAVFLHLQKTTDGYRTANGFAAPSSAWLKATSAIQDRLITLADAEVLLDFFVQSELAYTSEMLVPKKGDAAAALQALQWCATQLQSLTDDDFRVEVLREYFLKKIEEAGKKRGEVLWPLRVALTGKEQSPDVFAVAAALGKQKTEERITHACNILQK